MTADSARRTMKRRERRGRMLCLAGWCHMWWLLVYPMAGHVAWCIDPSVALGDKDNASWETFQGRQYIFILDAARKLDKSRDAAARDCQRRDASLISIETEDELSFIKESIRELVESIGSEFSHEQWWTSGQSRRGFWVWQNRERSLVSTSAMKRKTVPREGPHVLALSYIHGGWRFKIVPYTYQLRYICEKAMDGVVPPPVSYLNDIASNQTLQSSQEKLLQYLFSRYDQSSPPTIQRGESFRVHMTFHINDVISAWSEPVMTFSGLVTLRWQDFRLSWAPGQHLGIKGVLISAKTAWYPKVYNLYRLDNDRSYFPKRDDQLRLLSTGHVEWKGRIVCKDPCTAHARKFPFDSTVCSLWFGVPSKQHAFLHLSHQTNAPTNNSIRESQWTIDRVAVSEVNTDDNCSYESFNALEYSIHLSRHHIYDVITVVVPCATLAICLLFLLILPRWRKDKQQGLTCLIFALLLYIMCQPIRFHGAETPLIVYYSLFVLAMAVLGFFVSTMIGRLSAIDRRKPPPKWLLVCLPTYKRKGRRDTSSLGSRHLSTSGGQVDEDEAVTICLQTMDKDISIQPACKLKDNFSSDTHSDSQISDLSALTTSVPDGKAIKISMVPGEEQHTFRRRDLPENSPPPIIPKSTAGKSTPKNAAIDLRSNSVLWRKALDSVDRSIAYLLVFLFTIGTIIFLFVFLAL